MTLTRMTSLAAAAAAVVLASCSAEQKPAATSDTLTRRQRDSVVGESGLPGAQGVKTAIKASDSAAARNATLDSLNREP